MSEHLHETFDASKEKGVGPAYQHPQGDEILEASKAVLRQIPTGVKLLAVLGHYNIPVQVVSNREITFNVPDNKTVHVFCPNPAPKDLLPVAMSLALGIREVEHFILGYRLSSPNVYQIQSQEDMDIMFTKLLDITIIMCRIAEEYFDEVGDSKLIDYVNKLGHAEFYKAYSSRKNPKELEEILKRQMLKGDK